jgi:phenylalanyl-tRNA synthetase beta chain
MQLSKNWLLEWVNPQKTTEALCQQFTAVGLEVDSFTPVAPAFSGVVVAKILSADRHPDADKLQVCLVDDGSQMQQVVCGAKNARAGLTVALATVGAVLPGDFNIKAAKLRGVASNGMLCAQTELGLADASNGIMELPNDAPLGQDLREYLQLNDDIIDIDLTPNRGDCLSIKGLARELAAINELTITDINISSKNNEIKSTINVKVKEKSACPRYCARVIKGVNVNNNSPLWLQEKLRRCGIRSINPIVDVTNFVMLELGQPMHAFDLDTLSQSAIVVRLASSQEKLVLLDGQAVTLTEDTLIIADHDKPLAIAGVMGGKESGVTLDSRNIVLESAFFSPAAIQGKARYYGAHSDSSQRFERGVDPTMTRIALERATQLILDICDGEAEAITEVRADNDLPKPCTIKLRRARIRQLLGFAIADEHVESILQRLGMQLELADNGWLVTTPLHRFDLSLEEDLIEEVVRIYGYDHIPSIPPLESLTMLPATEQRWNMNALRSILVERGYHETMTYSFIDPKLQALIFPDEVVTSLQNPIAAQLSVMRTSLWPNLIMAVANNQKHQQSRLRFFEVGRVFCATSTDIKQTIQIAGVANGSRYPEQWGISDESIDFYDVKADVEAMFPEAKFVAAQNPALHPGQSAKIVLNDKEVGFIGGLHPRISQQLKIAGPVVLFAIEAPEQIAKLIPQYQQVSKYPQIRRDLALALLEKVTIQQVYDIVQDSAGELLVEASIFDLYRGERIAPNKKSIAVKMILQHPSRTLVDEEIAEIMLQVVNELNTKLNAELRE